MARLSQGVKHYMENNNATWSKYCLKDDDGIYNCEIIDTAKWGYNLTFDKNMCGIHEKLGPNGVPLTNPGHKYDKHQCTEEEGMVEGDANAGIGTRLPIV